MRHGCKMELRKLVAPEYVFGIGARLLAANYAVNLGARKVLVVTDPGVTAAGWTTDITESLEDAGLPYVIFDKVTSNPRAQEVMSGAELYLSENCNCIVAVGGGSPMDCAKGIGIVGTNHRDILEFEGADNVRIPIPPLICIPTTGGSAADVSQFAIITDTERKVKITIISKTIIPDVSLADPITLTTMPSDLALNTGVDALTHAFEAYVSNANSTITDLLALEAIRLIFKYLPASIHNPMDVEIKSRINDACLYAGLAFSNAGLGLVHAMSHSIGGYLGIVHGESNALLLQHVISFNFSAASNRYRKISEAIGLNVTNMSDQEVKLALLAEIERFLRQFGPIDSLSKAGISAKDIPDLARNAINDPNVATNPREPSLSDIEEIYERAL